jgi:hypothetical protein
MRTTLDLPDSTFRLLKAEAAQHGFKLKELVCQFIEDGLAARARVAGPVRARSPLPVFRRPTGVKNPALSNARIEAILSEDDAHGRP